MYRIKTKTEFEEMKKDILQKVDRFSEEWNEFTRYVSPKYWRSMGDGFNKNKLITQIKEYEPAIQKHLDNDWFRDEVLTDEEKDEWNTAQKYNL